MNRPYQKKKKEQIIDCLIMTTKTGSKFAVEVNWDKRTTCKKCWTTMRRWTTQRWKKIPITKKDGVWISHFENCKFADEFRKTSL